MFKLLGFSEKAAQAKMQNIMKLETTLAKASKSPAELRDPEANYNKITREEFNRRYPNTQLDRQLKATGIDLKYIDEVVVGQPDFVAAADKLIGSLTPAEYRDYMEWGQIMDAADLLSDDIIAAKFDFFGKTMSGRKENFPLWKRATQQVEGVMGEALGKIYVEKYFPASSKKRMVTLVRNLQTALGERIKAQDWMGKDRIPRQVGRPQPTHHRPLKIVLREHERVLALLAETKPRKNTRQTRRSRRVAHDTTDRQRIL